MLVVAAFPVVEAVRIVAGHPHVVLYGDQALLELGARRAAHLDQLVGPYSRDGFHHPGPAVFYVLAPFVALLGPVGMYLGAVTVNGACFVAVVALFWHRLGRVAALWAAASIEVFCLCVGVGTFREPWNPYLVIAPMVLFVVLSALARTGSRCAGIWALVVGSYVVQTHLATAPVVLVVAAAVVIGLVRTRRTGARTPSGTARVGLGLLALLWVALVVELWRDDPNNAQLLWRYFSSPRAAVPLGQALHLAGDSLSIVPFGNHDYVLALDHSPAAIAVAAVLLLVAGWAAVRLDRSPRPSFTRALVGAAAVGALVGTLALLAAGGSIALYLTVWLSFVPLALLLALGAAVCSSGRDRARASVPETRSPSLLVLGIVGVLALGTLAVRSDVAAGSVATTTGSGPWPVADLASAAGKERTVRDTAALTRAVEAVLGPHDREVGFTITSPGTWPYVAGAVLDLDERGVGSTVAPAAWDLYFGPGQTVSRPADVTFTISTDGTGPGVVVADVDGTVLTYERHSPG